jgi:FMN phosphatase YigB (HAD superfamily)
MVAFWLMLFIGATCTAFLPPCPASVRPATALQLSSSSSSSSTTLGLITFDLDDTLFPIAPVVEDANRAMITAMKRLGYVDSCNVAVWKHTTSIRKSTKIPLTYTELRMKAIRQELCQQVASKDVHIDDSVVLHCFDAWLNERHQSAERNLFEDAVSMLDELSHKYPYACIGAITNGRGNPLDMQSLHPYFDFCVSGEDDHVFPERKPRRGIYEASLEAYHERYPHVISDQHVWIHVGDCLANDVGGSHKCGAYAIWKDNSESLLLESNDNKQPKWSTASKRTVQNRRRLANQGKKLMSGQVTRLAELPTVVEEILQHAAASKHIERIQK